MTDKPVSSQLSVSCQKQDTDYFMYDPLNFICKSALKNNIFGTDNQQ